MFSPDRNQLRQMFFNAWEKHRQQLPLEPMEQMIAGIVAQHPEYHALLDDPGANLDREFTPEMGETNPFLHLAMHIAIQEQLITQRPEGIVAVHQSLLEKLQDPHEAEHRMMDCLADAIWLAQRAETMPDEQAYLDCLRKLAKS